MRSVFPDRPDWGTTYWDWTLIPVKNREGGVEGLVLSLHDVTERARTRQMRLARLSRARTLIDVSELVLECNEPIVFITIQMADKSYHCKVANVR